MKYIKQVRAALQEKRLWRDIFDGEWYKATYGDRIKGGEDPFAHFLREGLRDRLSPCKYFDVKWYLENYPDVASEGIHPIKHYFLHGSQEGRNPSRIFSTNWYKNNYDDVAESGLNPLVHYMKFGRFKNRKCHTMQDVLESIETCASAVFDLDHAPSNVGEFLMQHHVEPNGAPFGYKTTGPDPQLLVIKSVKAGFFRLKAKIVYSDLARQFHDQSSLEIFIGDENGFRQSNSWRYAINKDVCEFDNVLFNMHDFNYIRLDPLDTNGQFQIERFEIIPLTTIEAIQYLKSRHHEKFSGKPDYVPLTKETFTKEGVMDLVKACSDSEPDSAMYYANWIAKRSITGENLAYLQSMVCDLKRRPLFSIIMPVYKSNIYYLNLAISSVVNQLYENWELVIVDDGSNSDSLKEALAEWSRKDPRIKVLIESENRGISAASNIALRACAGEFVALVDHDDEIASHALAAMAHAINQYDDIDMLYSDEDKIDFKNLRSDPFFKPDWSPDYFLSCMYTCHLGVYRRSLVEAVGGFRSEYDFAQDYDLALRVSAKARRVHHVADILYHWRTLETSTASTAEAKPTAAIAARRAVQSAIDAEGFGGVVVDGPFTGSHRIAPRSQNDTRVSIVIPSAARRIDENEPRWYLLDLLKSISNSTYKNYEIVVVHNGDMEKELHEQALLHNVKLVHYDSAVFNISDKINLGVKSASGEYVVLLNDDMTIITASWLEELLLWMGRRGVSGVGCKLLFPDETIQHAGVLLLSQGPSHVYYGSDRHTLGLVGSAALVRNYSAVTGACLMVRKADFLQIGGFDPDFRINYNDVDFCLRLNKLGRIVYTPYAEIFHYESVSKGENPKGDLDYFNSKWANIIGNDQYYNVNLSQRSSVNEMTHRPRSLEQDYAF